MTLSTLDPPPAPAAEAMPATEVVACTNCGVDVAAAYCGACGQERLAPDDLTLRAFARRTAGEVLDVDSTLGRTLRTLLARPGVLTVEFVAGRRRAWVGPVRLYLMVMVVYFLVMWPYLGRMEGNPQQTLRSVPGIEKLAAKKGLAVDELVRRVDGGLRTSMQAMTNFGAIPLVAVALAVLYRRQRRRYAEHLVFTLHVTTQNSVVALLYALPLMGLSLATGAQLPQWVAWPTMAYFFWYTLRSVRVVYGRERSRRRTAAFFAANLLIMGIVGLLSMIVALLLA